MISHGLQWVVILIILALGIGVGIFVGRKFSLCRKEVSVSLTSTVKQILPVSEFACLVYHYSDVVMHSDSSKIFNLVPNPFTAKKAIYSVDGTVKLGFNGKEITIIMSLDTIVVQMPRIVILSHEMHPDTFRLYDEKTGLFSKYSLKNAHDIEKERKKEIEANVRANDDLFRQARESANRQFKSLLENLPGVKGAYAIAFEWPPLRGAITHASAQTI